MQTIDMLNTYMLNQELHEQQRIGPGSNMYLYILSVYIYRLNDSSRPPGCHCIFEIMHAVSEIVVRLRWTLLQRSIKLQRPLSCNLIVALQFRLQVCKFLLFLKTYMSWKGTVFRLKRIKISGVAASRA